MGIVRVGFGLGAFLFCFVAAGLDCSDAAEAEADRELVLSAAEKAGAVATHLPWGLPVAAAGAMNERVIHQREFITKYDDDLLAPLWTAYRLRAGDIVSRTRVNCFREDPRLGVGDRSTLRDYVEPVFDRGHMAPRAAMNRSKNAMLNTFVLSNMVPQYARFNQNTWATLEGRVRKWAELRGEIYVITGAVYDHNLDGVRDEDGVVKRMSTGRVGVASHFYKIVLHERPNGFVESLAILLPHWPWKPKASKLEEYFRDHLTTIDRIEVLTGIDFRVSSDSAREAAIEASLATVLWPTG